MTESLFAENHEPFFNSIDPSRRFSIEGERLAPHCTSPYQNAHLNRYDALS